MNGKMLGACMQLVIFGIGRALKSVYYRYSHPGCEVWVLTVCLLASAPAGITENVDVGGPEGETLIAAQASVLTGNG